MTSSEWDRALSYLWSAIVGAMTAGIFWIIMVNL